jgi:AcrR family transcriptional regulator
VEQHRTQSQRSRATREQIIQAALAVFAFKGYAAASMDEVCLAAGCSKGGLYHHFPTKQRLLAGVVKRLAETRELLPAAGDSAPPAVPGRILLDVWAEASRDDELRALLAETAVEQRSGALTLAEVLSIGSLVQRLAQGTAPDARSAAERLGLRPAA